MYWILSAECLEHPTSHGQQSRRMLVNLAQEAHESLPRVLWPGHHLGKLAVHTRAGERCRKLLGERVATTAVLVGKKHVTLHGRNAIDFY